MPRGLGELTCLCTLSIFVLSENNSMSRYSAAFSELGKLNDLRGELEIINLGYKEDMDAGFEEERDVIIKSRKIWVPGLKQLVVDGSYMGARFASWFHSLTNIVNLELINCDRCQHLPPLDHLPFLKRLMVYCLWNLKYISSEDKVKDFASDEMMMMSAASPSTTFFPSLESLDLSNCPNLKGWWRNEIASASSSLFPCLSTLTIRDCPHLDSLELLRSSWKVLPSSFVPSSKLKSLEIRSVEDIEYVPEEGIGNLTLLEKLEIKDCPNLVSLPDQGMGLLISLQRLHISNCPKLASLPEGIGNLTLLQHLKIIDCPKLASLPEGIGNLKSLISNLRIDAFPTSACSFSSFLDDYEFHSD